MTDRWRSRIVGDRGAGIVELSVAMLVSTLVVAMVVTWAGAVISTETHHSSDDEAVQALRIAKEDMGKDIRRAEALTVAGDRYLTLWIDLDRDGTEDSGEAITWMISGSGSLLRAASDGTSRVEAEGIVYEASGFTYDAVAPSEVENVTFLLVAEVTAQAGTEQRSIGATIHIRNA